MGQLPLALGLADHARFETYVAGAQRGRRRAHPRGRGRRRGRRSGFRVPRRPARRICSRPRAAARRRPAGERCTWRSMSRLRSPRCSRASRAWICSRSIGVERVAGDAAWERQLFVLFNELAARRGGLLLAARAAAGAAGFAMPDLASRAAGAVAYRLQPLADDDRLAALLAHAHGARARARAQRGGVSAASGRPRHRGLEPLAGSARPRFADRAAQAHDSVHSRAARGASLRAANDREQYAELEHGRQKSDARKVRGARGRNDFDARGARVERRGATRPKAERAPTPRAPRNVASSGAAATSASTRARSGELAAENASAATASASTTWQASSDRFERRTLRRSRHGARRQRRAASCSASRATRAPSAFATSVSSFESAVFHDVARCVAPYGEPPVRVSNSAVSVYGHADEQHAVMQQRQRHAE